LAGRLRQCSVRRRNQLSECLDVPALLNDLGMRQSDRVPADGAPDLTNRTHGVGRARTKVDAWKRLLEWIRNHHASVSHQDGKVGVLGNGTQTAAGDQMNVISAAGQVHKVRVRSEFIEERRKDLKRSEGCSGHLWMVRARLWLPKKVQSSQMARSRSAAPIIGHKCAPMGMPRRRS
jgi:hypothetical protein